MAYIYARMNRWAKAGLWDKRFEKLQEEQLIPIEVEAVNRDSPLITVHPDGAGKLKNTPAGFRSRFIPGVPPKRNRLQSWQYKKAL